VFLQFIGTGVVVNVCMCISKQHSFLRGGKSGLG